MVQDQATPLYSKPFRVEDYATGAVYVVDSDKARANKAVFERHLISEWESDIEATMATIHPDNPYQRIPALGVAVDGFEGIRQFYLGRFESWPGPALRSFDRVTITDTLVYVEGEFNVQATGDSLSGLSASNSVIRTPCMIVLECRDGLLLGEVVYMDASALKAAA